MPAGIKSDFNALFIQYGYRAVLLLRLVDMIVLFFAAWAAYYVCYGQMIIDDYHLLLIAIGMLGTIITLELGRIYGIWRNQSILWSIGRFLAAWAFALISVASIVALISLQLWFGVSYNWMGTWGGLGLFMLLTARSLSLYMAHWLHHRDWTEERRFLSTLNEMAQTVSQQIYQSTTAELNAAGYTDCRFAGGILAEEPLMPGSVQRTLLPGKTWQHPVDHGWMPLRSVSHTERLRHRRRPPPINKFDQLQSNKF